MEYKDFYPELLKEARLNVPVIIVDVQPTYDKWCGDMAYRLMEFLNKRKGRILAFYNGKNMGLDSESSTQQYFIEHGLDYDLVPEVDFREKTYAFFRNWMDKGMNRKDLIVAIRYMVTNRINDSGDIDTQSWKSVYGDRWKFVEEIIAFSEDMITIPDISISELKSMNGCYLCGGGKTECLSEFRLILESFNIKYKIIKDFVY